jgi:hypothetical protein
MRINSTIYNNYIEWEGGGSIGRRLLIVTRKSIWRECTHSIILLVVDGRLNSATCDCGGRGPGGWNNTCWLLLHLEWRSNGPGSTNPFVTEAKCYTVTWSCEEHFIINNMCIILNYFLMNNIELEHKMVFNRIRSDVPEGKWP